MHVFSYYIHKRYEFYVNLDRNKVKRSDINVNLDLNKLKRLDHMTSVSVPNQVIFVSTLVYFNP